MPLTIGERLKALRTEAGIQQAAVQKATGISRSSLSQYENGMRPPLDACVALAKFYRVPLDYLCCLSNDRTNVSAGAMDAALASLSDLAPDTVTRSQLLAFIEAAAEYCRAGSPCGSVPLEAAAEYLRSLTAAMQAAARDDVPDLIENVDGAIGAALRIHQMPGELIKRGK